MSTLAYAQFTNAREAAPVGASTTSAKPGMQTYIDALAALVPAEVLSLHALIISITTDVVKLPPGVNANLSGSSDIVTRIIPEAVSTLQWSFWVLILSSILLYVVPRLIGGNWDRFDFLRASIPPLAFIGWTMLQRMTAFDAVFPELGLTQRTVIALFLGAILGVAAAMLALKSDAKVPII